jgi:hypothetical protein
MIRSAILTSIENPRELEKLYHDNKKAFKTEFNLLYPEIKENKLAEFWNERLNFESPEISWGSKTEILLVSSAAIISAFIAKFPALFNINPEFFYPRNAGFIIFPMLAIYFAWKNGPSAKNFLFGSLIFLISAIYINLLPGNYKSDTLILSCIHLPIFFWGIVGLAYVGNDPRSNIKRLEFLRYNGELAIMAGLLVIAGGALGVGTIGLFKLIGFNIQKLYSDYIVICGGAAVPIVATYLTQTNPQLVNKISPVIAKIFSPLLLITLVAYLITILFSGKNPYNDRDFLMVFNFLLIGVMAIILFSIAETSKKTEDRLSGFILFALSVLTIIVNGIALSAILIRISNWGISPNRLAILGANILMLTNLLIVTFKLFRNISRKAAINEVGDAISVFLPVYILWTLVVSFIFPFIFHFK